MPFDGPAADLFGHSSTLLTTRDMSDDENVKDAAHQLQRCVTDFDFAGWAKRWGRPLTIALHGATPVDIEELEEARDAANEAEKELAELRSTAELAIKAFDNMAAELPDEIVNRINDIFARLEGAL